MVVYSVVQRSVQNVPIKCDLAEALYVALEGGPKISF